MTAEEKLELIGMLLEHVWPERSKTFDPDSTWEVKDKATRALSACLYDIRQVVNGGRESS